MNFLFSKPVPSRVAKKLLTPTRGEITHAHRLLRRKFDRNEASEHLQLGRDKMRGLRLSLELGRDIQPSLKEVCAGSNQQGVKDKKRLAQRIRGLEEHSIAVGNPKKGVRPEGLVTFAATYEGWQGLQEYYNDLTIYNPLQVNRRMAIGTQMWMVNSMARDIMVQNHLPRFIFAPAALMFFEYNVHHMMGVGGLPPVLSPLFFLLLKGQGARYFPAAMLAFLSTFISMPRVLEYRATHQASHDAFWGPQVSAALEQIEAGEDPDAEMGDWFYESYNYLVPKVLLEASEYTHNHLTQELQSPPSRRRGPQNKMVYIDRLMDFRGDEPELTVVVRITDSAFKFAKQDEKKSSTAFLGALTFGTN